jgi:hypothetical protein
VRRRDLVPAPSPRDTLRGRLGSPAHCCWGCPSGTAPATAIARLRGGPGLRLGPPPRRRGGGGRCSRSSAASASGAASASSSVPPVHAALRGRLSLRGRWRLRAVGRHAEARRGALPHAEAGCRWSHAEAEPGPPSERNQGGHAQRVSTSLLMIVEHIKGNRGTLRNDHPGYVLEEPPPPRPARRAPLPRRTPPASPSPRWTAARPTPPAQDFSRNLAETWVNRAQFMNLSDTTPVEPASSGSPEDLDGSVGEPGPIHGPLRYDPGGACPRRRPGTHAHKLPSRS